MATRKKIGSDIDTSIETAENIGKAHGHYLFDSIKLSYSDCLNIERVVKTMDKEFDNILNSENFGDDYQRYENAAQIAAKEEFILQAKAVLV